MMGRKPEQFAEIKRALELDPLNAVYCVWLGQFLAMDGKWDEAMAEGRNALELNAEIPDGLVLLGEVYAEMSDFADAIACQEKATALDPGLSRYYLARTYARAGRKDDALRIASTLEKDPGTWDAYGLTIIYAALGEKDKAFRWLETMFQAHHMYAPWISVSHEFAPLRSDPRFKDYLRRLRLPLN